MKALSKAALVAEDDGHFNFATFAKVIDRLKREKFRIDTTKQEARSKACFFRGVDKAILTASAYHDWRRPFFGLGGGSANGKAMRSAR